MPSPTKPRARGPGPHPFRRGDTWWARIPTQRPPWPQRSLGTTDKRVALSRCAMLRQLADRGDWDTLAHLVAGTRDLVAVHTAWQTQQLPGYLATERAKDDDPDLAPYVPRWHAATAKQRPKVAGDYLRMVRTLIPDAGPFLRSQLTKPAIRQWLDVHSGPTRNRYRTGLSSFVGYLVDLEVIEYNLVLAIKAAPERAPRCRYLTTDEARAVVAALPPAHAALHALLLATGGDVAGALRVRFRDVDLAGEAVRIPGTKAHTRDAVRRFLVPWALDVVASYLRQSPGVPAAPVFAPILEGDDSPAGLKRAKDRTLHHLQTACKAVGIDEYSTRDHRHTFAVQALRDGYSFHVVAHQLGHGTTALVHKVYGRFAVTDADYARRTTAQHAKQPAAASAT